MLIFFLIEILTLEVAHRVSLLLKDYTFFKIYEHKAILKKYSNITRIEGDGYNYLAVPNTKLTMIEDVIRKWL